jgi:hypothetical protein
MKRFSIGDTFTVNGIEWTGERFVFDATDPRFVDADNRGGWLVEAVCIDSDKVGQRTTFTLSDIENCLTQT